MKAGASFPVLLLISALTPWPVQAESFRDYPDLPPLKTVMAVMANNPVVQAAKAGVALGEASQARLQAGPYEYNVRLGTARRTVDQSGRLREWDVALERPIRLPGKLAADEELGREGVIQARAAYGDALHEEERKLLKLWFTWARENAQAQQWQAQAATLREQLAIVNKRVRAGDAPRLEAEMAEAAAAQADVSLHQAQLRKTIAATELTKHFSGITLPEKLAPAPLEPLQQELDYWRDLILRHNHELAVARSEARMAQLVATRTSAERAPDPSLGVRYSSEIGGTERVVGLSVAIPLPGAARTARTQESQASAEMAARREAMVLRKLEAETENTFTSARASHTSWLSAQAAAERMQRNAELVARAYALGEMSLTEVLNARRLAIESNLAAALARFDAAEARYRLMLDAHLLWPLDADEDDASHGHG
jgi:outer membrane protein TolC